MDINEQIKELKLLKKLQHNVRLRAERLYKCGSNDNAFSGLYDLEQLFRAIETNIKEKLYLLAEGDQK